ncbi:transposase family protein, partial [Thauera aromatica]
MDIGKLADMVEVFEGIEDWRNAQQTRHSLSELLTVAVCAVLSGADDFEEISQW